MTLDLTRRSLIAAGLSTLAGRAWAAPASDLRLLVVFLRGAYDAANVVVNDRKPWELAKLEGREADLHAATGIDEVRDQRRLADSGDLPPWLGNADFHLSHQSALVRKDPEFYRPLFGDVPDDLGAGLVAQPADAVVETSPRVDLLRQVAVDLRVRA